MIHGIGLREERYEIGHEFTRALEIVGRVPIEIEAPQSIPQIPATAFNDGLCDSRGDLTDFVGCRHRKIICRNFKTKFDRDLGHHTEYTVGGWARNFMDSDEVRDALVLVQNHMCIGPLNFQQKFDRTLATPKNFVSQFDMGLEGPRHGPGFSDARTAQDTDGRTELRESVFVFL